MATLLAILSGFLVSCGVFCLLQRSFVKLVLGVVLLGQAANLIIFCSAGLGSNNPAIIGEGEKVMSGTYADPLPQALVLTAIVIGFGFTAFLLALLHRTHKTLETDDIETLKNTDTEL